MVATRWSMLGSGLGAGIASGLDSLLGPKFAIKGAERAAKFSGFEMTPEAKQEMLKNMLLSGAGLGASAKSVNPLEMLMMKKFFPDLFPEGSSSSSGTTYFTPIGSNTSSNGPTGFIPPPRPTGDGAGRIVYNNYKDSGSIEVQDRATGQYGLIPINEYDPSKYIKVGGQ